MIKEDILLNYFTTIQQYVTIFERLSNYRIVSPKYSEDENMEALSEALVGVKSEAMNYFRIIFQKLLLYIDFVIEELSENCRALKEVNPHQRMDSGDNVNINANITNVNTVNLAIAPTSKKDSKSNLKKDWKQKVISRKIRQINRYQGKEKPNMLDIQKFGLVGMLQDQIADMLLINSDGSDDANSEDEIHHINEQRLYEKEVVHQERLINEKNANDMLHANKKNSYEVNSR